MDKLRTLGSSGVGVSPVGLGCMGMSAFYGPADEEESIATLNEAIAKGCTFWDTADIYGENEVLLSKVLKENRDKVFLCTKFAVRKFPDGSMGICGTPEYVKEACEKSLSRLGVSHIDLYYQHRIDLKTPIEDTVRGMAELVKEGKVRYLGLSECSAENIRRANAVHPIAAYQVEYSPWCTDIEQNEILKTCRELNIAIIAYSPLGRGLLSGHIKSIDDLAEDDWRRTNPRFQGENFAKNLELAEKFREMAKTKGCTPSQLCLAWVMAQGQDFIPIPGTKRRTYLSDNIGAASVTLTDDENKQVRTLIDSVGGAQGLRYPEAMMTLINA